MFQEVSINDKAGVSSVTQKQFHCLSIVLDKNVFVPQISLRDQS